MHEENTRSRAPHGTFRDESSEAPEDVGRSVHGTSPYRDSRESLKAHRDALAKELGKIDAALSKLGAPPPRFTLPPASPNRLRLAELVAIAAPRRAIGVMALGMVAGTLVSTFAVHQLSGPPPVRERVLVTAPRHPRHHAPRREGAAPFASGLVAPRRSCDAPLEPVTRIDEHRWSVDESALRDADLLGTLRMMPYRAQSGRLDGIRIFGIRPGTVPSMLGLENGDVIRRANGIEILGADGAFAALEVLRSARVLRVELLREGQPRVHTYALSSRASVL